MRERPIIYSPPMVLARKSGDKTQTRRVSKEDLSNYPVHKCPYGIVGDRLWVRENFSTCYNGPEAYQIIYTADGERKDFSVATGATDEQLDWLESSMNVHGESGRPAIHLPRWASRDMDELTNVRCQRVNEISEADAQAEGPKLFSLDHGNNHCTPIETYKSAFKFLWNSINSKRGYGWETNPWVWALTFKRLTPLPKPPTVEGE